MFARLRNSAPTCRYSDQTPRVTGFLQKSQLLRSPHSFVVRYWVRGNAELLFAVSTIHNCQLDTGGSSDEYSMAVPGRYPLLRLLSVVGTESRCLLWAVGPQVISQIILTLSGTNNEHSIRRSESTWILYPWTLMIVGGSLTHPCVVEMHESWPVWLSVLPLIEDPLSSKSKPLVGLLILVRCTYHDKWTFGPASFVKRRDSQY